MAKTFQDHNPNYYCLYFRFEALIFQTTSIKANNKKIKDFRSLLLLFRYLWSFFFKTILLYFSLRHYLISRSLVPISIACIQVQFLKLLQVKFTGTIPIASLLCSQVVIAWFLKLFSIPSKNLDHFLFHFSRVIGMAFRLVFLNGVDKREKFLALIHFEGDIERFCELLGVFRCSIFIIHF